MGKKSGSVLPGSETLSLAKRLTTMEMKELNERQRAEHAVRMQTQMRNSLHELEMRNAELEQKFAEVMFLPFFPLAPNVQITYTIVIQSCNRRYIQLHCVNNLKLQIPKEIFTAQNRLKILMY